MEPICIDRIRVMEINLPLRVPFQISGGTMTSRRSLIVELHSGAAVGYGESAPFEFPFYSSETLGSVAALYHDLLLKRILGRTFDSIESFDATLRHGVRGNPFARCGLENAFWDLVSVVTQRSLPQLIAEKMTGLGVEEKFRRPGARVASGVAVGIPESEDPGLFRVWISGYAREGYQRVKIKIRPGWDTEPCRVAREVLGGDFLLWADANASYDLELHRDELLRLDDYKLAFLEQPLHHDDLLDHAELARRIKTPICIDESLKSERVGRQAIAVQAAPIWNIKVQRMGGLLEAIRAYALGVRNGIRLWGGTMPESGVGAQAILALASFPGFVYPADIEPSERWYHPKTDPLPIAMDPDGWINVPTSPGIGRLMDLERYEASAKIIFANSSLRFVG